MHVFEMALRSQPAAVACPFVEAHCRVLSLILAADSQVAYVVDWRDPQTQSRFTASALHTIIDRIGQQIVAERGASSHFTAGEVVSFCGALSEVVCLSGYAYPGQQLPDALEERLDRVAEDSNEHDLCWHDFGAVTLAGLHQWLNAAVSETAGANHGNKLTTGELTQVVDRFLAAIVKHL